MYYEAEVYSDNRVKNRFIANTIEVLKVKAEPYISDNNVDKIIVRKVEEVGYFKVQECFREMLDEYIL